MSRVVNLLSSRRPHGATRAILLYEADGASYATVHPLRPEDGVLKCGPGSGLSRDDLAAVLRQLSGQSEKRELRNPHVLFGDGSRLLWYCKSQRRPAFFHTGRKEFDQEMQGKSPLWPALLFLAVPQNLYVWALPTDTRPEAGTKLCVATCLNIYGSGHMCAGTTKLPLTVTGETAPWERAFFETTFTHSNRVDLTKHPGGHDGLWRELAQKKVEPRWKEWLVPVRMTVGDALNLKGVGL